MRDPLTTLDDWKARCRRHGLGPTAPRIAILTAMLELERATDAVIILQRARLHCASTSLDTTYRFLRELRRRGLVEALPMRRTHWRLIPLESPMASQSPASPVSLQE
ncbi:hypothetical protein ACYJW8_05930 [Frateuria aurantia]